MRSFKIGTRGSRLALWQSSQVASALRKMGYKVELTTVETLGDKNGQSHIAAFDSTGVFTDALDTGLLGEQFDMAVHSLKDVPTILPDGISLSTVFDRANPWDVFIPKSIKKLNGSAVIGTSSVRRSSQWLRRYPDHVIAPLRGNVDTRLRKLRLNEWDGIILAHAGLSRIGILPKNSLLLDWMLPAPGQAILAVGYRTSDTRVQNAIQFLTDKDTERIAFAERAFLHDVGSGCSSPAGALAVIDGDQMRIAVNVLSVGGEKEKRVTLSGKKINYKDLGLRASEMLKRAGGKEIINEFVR